MIFGILVFSHAIILGISYNAHAPRASINFCDVGKKFENIQCHCEILETEDGPTCANAEDQECSSDDNAKANQACQAYGFSQGCCTNHPDFTDVSVTCQTYVCNTTKHAVFTDFEKTNVKNPDKLKCYCPDDYEDSDLKDAVTNNAKAIYRLQISHTCG